MSKMTIQKCPPGGKKMTRKLGSLLGIDYMILEASESGTDHDGILKTKLKGCVDSWHEEQ